MKSVTIFTTPTCSYCTMAKHFFDENKVDFKEKNVAADLAAREEMINMSGQLGVPVIEVGKDVVIGFNQPVLKKLLDIN